MSRSFDILTESPASVEQIHAAFGRGTIGWPASRPVTPPPRWIR
jgi:hypothetical protein